MRSRRFRRGGLREPLHWQRAGGFMVHPNIADTVTDSIVLFDPQFVTAGAAQDQEYTVRRVVLDGVPVVEAKASGLGTDSVVFLLRWWVIIIDKNAPNPGVPAQATLYTDGWDIVQLGSMQATYFPPQALPALSSIVQSYPDGRPGEPWIDFNVMRKVNTGEQMRLILEASLACDAAISEDTETPNGWCVEPHISVLYQRTMRKR